MVICNEIKTSVASPPNSVHHIQTRSSLEVFYIKAIVENFPRIPLILSLSLKKHFKQNMRAFDTL